MHNAGGTEGGCHKAYANLPGSQANVAQAARKVSAKEAQEGRKLGRKCRHDDDVQGLSLCQFLKAFPRRS
jgi:hypothetical protein